MSDTPTSTPVRAPSRTAVIAAELIGTFWLVLGGCGTAVFAAIQVATADTGDVAVGVGYLGVSLAFGLTVLTGAYALGHISGGHFNPAVTVGAAIAGRLPWAAAPVYIVSQVVGGLLAGAVDGGGVLPRRRGARPAVAVLGGADRRRPHRRRPVQPPVRRAHQGDHRAVTTGK